MPTKHAKAGTAPVQTVTAALEVLEAGRAAEALKMLEPFRQRFPGDARLLRVVTGALQELQQFDRLQDVLEELSDLEPDAGVCFFLAATYARNGYLFKALDMLEKTARRFPEDPRTASFSPMLASTTDMLNNTLTHIALEDRGDLLRLREELQFQIDRERFAEARRVSRRLLDRWPDDVPTLNLQGQLELIEGQTAEGLTLGLRALQTESTNIFSLSMVIRGYCFMGEFESARRYVARLQQVGAVEPRAFFEKARAFATFGADEAVLDVLAQFEALPDTTPSDRAGVLAWGGLARVAQGEVEEGRKLLERALQGDPFSTLIRENLADVDLPLGSRNGPFPLPVQDWLGSRFIKIHAGALERLLRLPHGKSKKEEAARVLAAHPYLEKLLSTLLSRGDALGRQLALNLALNVDRPACREALLEFVSGQGGTDAVRWTVVEWLRERQLLPLPRVHFWWKGGWRDMAVVGLKLRDDAEAKHRQDVAHLLEEAHQAYVRDDLAEAESLLFSARNREPQAADIQLNLATVYLALGRHEEAEDILGSLETGRSIALRIDLLGATGRLEEALALVVPAMSREWQRTDFARFCDAALRVNVASGNAEDASIEAARRMAVPDEAPIPWQVRGS